MPPKTIVQAAFEAKVSPILEEKGFTYVPSQFAYKRRKGIFTQIISITLSHSNSCKDIRFWSAFNIDSPRYNASRKDHGEDKIQGYLGGCMDWNILKWKPEGAQRDDANRSYPYAKRLGTGTKSPPCSDRTCAGNSSLGLRTSSSSKSLRHSV